MENVDSHIWERQEVETDKSYAAFELYRNMGPFRSLAKAYSESLQNGKNRIETGSKQAKVPSHWREWSSEYNWVERAKAFDQFAGGEAIQNAIATVRSSVSEVVQIMLDVLRLDAADLMDGKGSIKKAKDMPDHVRKLIESYRHIGGNENGVGLVPISKQFVITQLIKIAGLEINRTEMTGKDGKDLIPEESSKITQERLMQMFNVKPAE